MNSAASTPQGIHFPFQSDTLVRVDLSPKALALCKEILVSSTLGTATIRAQLHHVLDAEYLLNTRNKRYPVFMSLACAQLLKEQSLRFFLEVQVKGLKLVNRGLLAELQRATATNLSQLATQSNL